MNDEKSKSLLNSLFILVSSFNTVLDRIDIVTDRNEQLFEMQERLITQNQKAFELAREDFFRKLIEAEVDKHTTKKEQSNVRRANFGSDIVRKAKRS